MRHTNKQGEDNKGRKPIKQHGTTKVSSKRTSRGGLLSKQRRKEKRRQEQAIKSTLEILRAKEHARKCETSSERKLAVQKDDNKSSDDIYPPQLLLPPPEQTGTTTERSTVLFKNDESNVKQTILNTLQQVKNKQKEENITVNNVVSNVLEEVYNDDNMIFEYSSFQEVEEVEKVEVIDIESLEKKWYHRYYKPNPDNNKRKFHDLGFNRVENVYGYSQDNHYLSNVYTYNKQQFDCELEEKERLRQEATALFSTNQAAARQNEKQTKRKEIELTTQQKEENNNFRSAYKNQYFKQRKQR